MIKKSLLTTIVFIFVISFNSNAYSYEDLPFAQYFVRIKKEDINVRAKPSTSSEIMDQLKKGSDVLVVGENGSWYQIQPKKNLRFAYIHKKLVQDGLVSKSRVNVRSGPSTSTSILGQMMEGDPILEVSRENEWIKI